MDGKSILRDFFLMAQASEYIADIRNRMMITATRYAFNAWQARAYGENRHIRHDDTVNTPDRHSGPETDPPAPDYYYLWPFWRGWGNGGNCGVPYFWNGDAALDPNLGDFLQTGELTFDQVLAEGWNGKFDAGDISKSTDRWKSASGIDCSGFVSQVWALGQKYNSNQLGEANLGQGDNLSRPIRFVDLERGDLLHMHGHVMLLAAFLTNERATANLTKILAVESATWNSKVSFTEYLLAEIKDISVIWKGIESIPSNEVTLQRIATWHVAWPGTSDNDLSRIDLNDYEAYYREVNHFKPRTHISWVDVILVIDRSGSMRRDQKLEGGKQAAQWFVDLMRPYDKIGVVSFDSEPFLAYPLTEIDPEGSVKSGARNEISSLEATTANTSIAAGLDQGFQQLTTTGAVDPVRIMILLSDGLETETNYPFVSDNDFEVLKPLRDHHIVVWTVALGNDADHGLLREIAGRTGGEYWYAPSAIQLSLIYSAIASRVYGESTVTTTSGTVASGGTAEEKVLVDSTVGSTTFSLFWRGSELYLTLVQPDGSIIDPSVAESNPKVSFILGGTYQFFKIYNPQAGEWTMTIYGKSTPAEGEAYSISVSAMSAMDASISFDKAEYFAGDPIKIEARIEDTFIDFAEPNYVLGAVVKVTVEDPYLNQYSFNLYDDGLHADGGANDGVYANTFASTSLIGNYNFKVQISGANNRDGQRFTREYASSHVVKDPTLRFPNAPVLDDFNRKKGTLGRSWSGAKDGYRIVGQHVKVRRGGPIYWKPGILVADQQAFITLAHVDPAGLEQGVLLKVQGEENHRGSWRTGAIAVLYNARESKVGIKSRVPGQEWETLAMFDATLQDGDQLGGRAEADGKVRAYVNGVETGSVDADSFFTGKGGRIGMWINDADDAVLDDFGGGGAINVPVIQSTDDAGPEPSVCGYRTDDGNIYFGHCMDGSPIVSGFRFQNVSLPARATIVEAHLEFTVDGPYANEMALQFLGERSANAATFRDTDRPSDRPMTAALVPWAIPATDVWTFNRKGRTPAVTAIVEELVNLPGWASGNAMVIIVQADPAVPGDTHRRVYGWDREASAAARLVVIYTIESLARGDGEDDDENDDDDEDDR